MLLRLEQCVAYGVSAGLDAPGGEGQQELVAACLASAAEAMARGTSSSDEAIYAGFLFKKGGGTSTLGRRTWKPRYFEVGLKLLLTLSYCPLAAHPQLLPLGYLPSAATFGCCPLATAHSYRPSASAPCVRGGNLACAGEAAGTLLLCQRGGSTAGAGQGVHLPLLRHTGHRPAGRDQARVQALLRGAIASVVMYPPNAGAQYVRPALHPQP